MGGKHELFICESDSANLVADRSKRRSCTLDAHSLVAHRPISKFIGGTYSQLCHIE